MKTTKTIPFDWELYNSNRDKYKVFTRDGDEVTQLTYFDSHHYYKLAGVTEGRIETWTIDGMYNEKSKYGCLNLQLQYEEEVVESWANLYESVNGQRHIQSSYNTKEEAVKSFANTANFKYIKTINLNDL